jgi:hypothetical protein
VQFVSSDLPIAPRPSVDVQIGTGVYRAQAPKLDVWRQTTQMLSDVDRLNDLAESEQLSDDEKTELDTLLVTLSDLRRLEEAVLTGVHVRNEAGEVFLQGGFLRRCLTPESWEAVEKEWRNDQTDLDVDHLFNIAYKLQAAFEAWFDEREDSMGLPSSPKIKTAAKRRSAAAKTRTR